MKKIALLNGAARKNGNTAELVRAFTKGAESAGNEVREVYLQDLELHGCMGCNACRNRSPKADPCVQHDGMAEVYDAFLWADVIVFASPIYYSGIVGPLKTANDRLYALWSTLGARGTAKDGVLICTGAMRQFDLALDWYAQFPLLCGWRDLGHVLRPGTSYGLGRLEDPEGTEQARRLGASIG